MTEKDLILKFNDDVSFIRDKVEKMDGKIDSLVVQGAKQKKDIEYQNKEINRLEKNIDDMKSEMDRRFTECKQDCSRNTETHSLITFLKSKNFIYGLLVSFGTGGVLFLLNHIFK